MRDMTTIQVGKDTWEDLFRIKTKVNLESMDSVIKNLIKNDTSGYKPEIEIQNKTSILKKVKKNNEDVNKLIDEALK